jgi:hypothetical protein
MYETSRQSNLFPLSTTEMNLNAYGLSKTVLPEITHLSSNLEEYYFKPLFTPDEPFPDLFEDLLHPKNYRDLIFGSMQTEERGDQRKEDVKLSGLVKSNKRLLKKIETVLRSVSSLNEKQVMEVGSGRMRLSLRQDGVFLGRESEKRMTGEKLRSKLESESVCLLNLLRNWTVCSANHEELIDSMERYKSLINKYVRRSFRREHPIDQLRNLLFEAKNTQVERVNSLFQNETIEGHGKHTVKRRAIKSKHKHIWTQLSLFFLNINQDMKHSLSNFESPFIRTKDNIQFLNMLYINKLSAIAKMLQYCLDNGITVAEFMEDRTYQKIKARLKRIEDAALVYSAGTIKEVMHCPSLNEIPYLLSLKNADIGSIANVLKNNVTSSLSFNYLDMPLKCEEELKKVEEKNKGMINRLNERISRAKEIPVPQIKMSKDICRVKKRKRKRKKDEKFKRQKLEDSGSDTNATPKEHSVKTTIQLPLVIDGPKFKVVRYEKERSFDIKL